MAGFKTIHEARRAHAALDIPECPGEREWLDRIRTWEDVERYSVKVYKMVRAAPPEERERLIAMAPAVWDWLSRAYGVLRGRG